MKRIYSIDFTRGLVMIIMALDHVRDLMHTTSVIQSPTDLTTTTPILFFTRWITYLCAPIFVFLAGTSVYLGLGKGRIEQSRTFLLKRGFWLIVLEFTVVSLGVFFDPGFHTLLFEVIAAIGFGFIVLSLLLRLPTASIGLLGLVIIFCHGLLALVPFAQGSPVKAFFTPLFGMAAYPFSAGHVLVIAYPPVPWLGIMMAGFGAGPLFRLPADRRKKTFLWLGLAALVLFVLVRFINIYGDPVLWSTQKTAVYTFLSFMNVTKYPPSLLFCLVTLGIMCLMIAAAEHTQNRFTNIAGVYGKVPLFYFVLHFYLIHCLLIVLLLLQGYRLADLEFASGTFGRPKDKASGIPLWAVYLVWIAVVAALYQPCLWFGRYKATYKQWWLRYV